MTLVASKRHTLTLLAIFLGVAALLALQAQKTTPGPAAASRVPLYLGAMAFEWLLFWATLRGLRAAGTPLRTIMGGGSLVRGLLLGLVAWPLVLLVGFGAKWVLAHFGLHVDADTARTVARVGPHGALEVVLWVLLSLSAGICEEFVFRGYLMRQLAAWFGSWPAGVVASAIIFGLGHAYQGLGPVLTIIVHGISFGLVALFTRRLVPGMAAHALEDIVAGLS
jgi:membrane protease YdiL (CAAX protease family)